MDRRLDAERGLDGLDRPLVVRLQDDEGDLGLRGAHGKNLDALPGQGAEHPRRHAGLGFHARPFESGLRFHCQPRCERRSLVR